MKDTDGYIALLDDNGFVVASMDEDGVVIHDDAPAVSMMYVNIRDGWDGEVVSL